MDRLLTQWRAVAAVVVALAVSMGSSFFAFEASATTYSGISTGYAFGNFKGAANQPIGQGDFANHLPKYCPGDPAADWSFGTVISNVSPSVAMLDGDGGFRFWTLFVLRDVGDFSCPKGNYWADWYFGRWKRSADACSCNNGAEVCWIGVTNNCVHATNRGNITVTYDR